MQRRRKSTTSVSAQNSSRVSRATRLEAVRRASLATYERLENRQMLSITPNPLPPTAAGTGWTAAYYNNQGGGSTNGNSGDPLNDALGVDAGQGSVTPIYSKIIPTIDNQGNQNAGPPGVPGYNNGANYSIRYDGYVKAPNSGTGTFWVGSDDGVQVAIDETPLSAELNGTGFANWVVVDQRMRDGRGTGNLGGGPYNESIKVTTGSALPSPNGEHNDTQNDPTAAAFSFVAGELYHVELAYQNGGGGWGAHLGWSGAVAGTAAGSPSIIPQASVYPMAPAVLNATTNQGTGVNTITFQNSVNYGNLTAAGPADTYVVSRSTDGNTFTPIATINPDYSGNNAPYTNKGFVYVDKTAVDGTAYVYKVTASNWYGTDVEFLNGAVSQNGQLSAPTHVTALRAGTTTVNLTWDVNSNAVGGFDIKRGTGIDGSGHLTGVTDLGVVNNDSTFATSFTDTTGAANTNYYYTVTALHGATINPDPAVTDSNPSAATFVGFGDGWDTSYYGFKVSPTGFIDNNNPHTVDDASAALGFQRIESGPIKIGAPNFGNNQATGPNNYPVQWTATGANSVLADPSQPGFLFGGRWVGYIEAPVTGYYTFGAGSDDGNNVVYYDQNHLDGNGNPIGVPLNTNNLNADRGVPAFPYDQAQVVDTTGAPVLFTAGQKYLIQYEFNNGGGGWGANLLWSASATTTPSAADLMTAQFVPTGDVMAPVPIFKTVYANDVALDGSGHTVFGPPDANGRMFATYTGTNITEGSVTKDASFYTLKGVPNDSAVQLTWNNIGASTYNIYLYDNGTDAVPNPATTGYTGLHAVTQVATGISASQGAALVKTLTGLTNNHHYTFYVSGVDQAGETPFASTTSVTVTPVPVAPSGAQNVLAVNDNTVNFPLNFTTNTDSVLVTWTATPFAVSYNVFRSVDGGTPVKISTDGAVTGTSFHDPNRPLGHSYTYTVSGTNTGGTGAVGAGGTIDLTHGTTEGYYSNVDWYANGFNNPGYTNVSNAIDNLTAQPQVNYNQGNQGIANIGASVADQAAGRGFQYSTVYEGTIVIPVSGNYNIGAENDDNSALILNGQLAFADNGCCQDHYAANTHYNAGDHVSYIMFSQQGGGGHQQNLIWNYVSDDTTVTQARQNIPQANLLLNDGVPTAPSGATATADATPGVVDISVTDNSINELNFTLLKSSSPTGPFTAVAGMSGGFVVGINGTATIKDTSMLPGTWYYEVVANNLYGHSAATAATTTGITVTSPNTSTEHFYNNQYWGTTNNASNYLTPSLSPFFVSTQPQINQNTGNPVGSGSFGGNQLFSVVFTGKITVPTNGTLTTSTYQFITASDDDSYFVVDGQMASAAPGPHGVVSGAPTQLVLIPGHTYNFQYYMSQGGGGYQFKASWVLPNADGTAGALGAVTNGEYANAVPIPATAFSAIEDTPAAPTALPLAQTYSKVGSTSATISFTDNSISEVEFTVQRSTSANFTTGVTTVFAPFSANAAEAAATGNFNDTGLTPATTYYYRIAATNYDGSSTFTALPGSVTTFTYGAPSYFSANPGNSLETVIQWTNATLAPSPLMAIESSPDGVTWTQIATTPVNGAGLNQNYHISGGTAGTVTYYRIRGVDSATPTLFGSYTIAQAAIPVAMPSTPALINYSAGFTGAVTGGALINNNGGGLTSAPVLADGNLQITENVGNETRTVWTATKVGVTNFTTTFDYTATGSPGATLADGFTFTLQNDPRGTGAIGDGGGSKGVAGAAVVTPSISLVVQPFNGAAVSQGLLYENGVQVGTPQDLSTSGIDLYSGHTFQFIISYDGTNLTASLTDVTSLSHPTATFAPLPINLTTQLGGTTAYAGFTGATGGLQEQQLISNWTYAVGITNTGPAVAAFTVPNSTAGTAFASTPVNFTGSNGDSFSAAVDYGDGSGVQTITGLTVTGGNGSFNISHTYAAAGNYTVSITVTDTTTTVTSTPARTANALVTQAAPNLTSTVVGDGTTQRSVFKSITLNFDEAVTLSAGAFTMNKVTTGTVDDGLGNPNSVTHPILTSTDVSTGLTFTQVGDGHQWIVSVTPLGILDNGFGDFADGVYKYTLHAANITNGSSVAMAGGDQSASFMKRYGDIDGDGLVGNIDFGQFKTAFAKSAAATPVNTPKFDVDHDGTVGNIDFGRFKTNFTKAQQFLPS